VAFNGTAYQVPWPSVNVFKSHQGKAHMQNALIYKVNFFWKAG
jgi:hypothetical protein